MAVLLAHHLEEYWDESLRNYNTSFDEEIEKVCDFIKHSGVEVNKIIVTSFENNEWDDGHFPLISLAESLNIPIEHEVYGYAMTRILDDEESMKRYPKEKENITWCYGERDYHDREGNEQDVLDIEDWIKELRGNDVVLIGAFEGECLNDMETILNNQEISYHKVDELCVGTGQIYIIQEETIVDELFENTKSRLENLEDKMLEKLEKYSCEDINDLVKKKPHIVQKMLKEILEISEDFIEKIEDKDIDKESYSVQSNLENMSLYLEEIQDAFIESVNEENISLKESVKIAKKNKEVEIENNPHLYPRPRFSP